MEHVTEANLKEVMQKHIHSSADIMTDEARAYKNIGPLFASHQAVNHSQDEYVVVHSPGFSYLWHLDNLLPLSQRYLLWLVHRCSLIN